MKEKGFALIELLVVISIIAVLSVIGMTVFSGVQNNARNTKVSADFNAIYKNIDIARMLQQKTLGEITGSWCSECSCRGVDALGCLSVMTASYANLTSAPFYPWTPGADLMCSMKTRKSQALLLVGVIILLLPVQIQYGEPLMIKFL